ncbi:MAG: ROK family protein [Candidatus Margulisbacteria bacterium]|nr:ROK family protein [Candidatus Margulisiibacteriota bacterium]
MNKEFIIGIDVGGTKIAAAIADNKGNILANFITPTEAKKGDNVVADKILLCIKHLLKESGLSVKKLKNIVIGIPGQIDRIKGIILNAPNIAGWKDFNIQKYLHKEFPKTKILLENDAHCATMGEFFYGAGKEFRNMIFLTISTGIGGGIILNKKLYSGKHHIAGEIGHMALNLSSDEDHKCGCGRMGCFEAYASGINMAKRAQKKLKDLNMIKDDYGGKILELAEGNLNKITAVIISQAASMQDKFACEIIEENGFYIGIACVNLINLLDPDAIILGGGVSKIGTILFDSITKTVHEHVKMTSKLETQILPAKTGTDAGILGALAIGISR